MEKKLNRMHYMADLWKIDDEEPFIDYSDDSICLDNLSKEELKEALVKLSIEQKKVRLENKPILDYLQDIVSLVPGSIYWKNADGIYIGCNDFMAKTAGLAPMEIIGKTDNQLWPNQANELNVNDYLVFEQGKPLRIEEKIDLPSGETKYFIVDKMPLRDNTGKITGVIGNSIEITDLKKTQAALEIANRVKSDFIANMSHDIRTPLTGIIGMCKLMEERLEEPEFKQYAHWVNESGKQLLSLLNGILNVVSSDYINDGDIIYELFDLHQCLQDIAELELPTIKLKKLNLIIDVPPNIPRFVISDHTKLHRILLNLVGNSIKFTDKGFIKIEVILMDSVGDKVRLQFRVTDTGIGIPDELQSKVFDRFFRVNPSYKGIYKGHGIGLHIAQSYAELLGGQIKLTSKINVGTSIFFEIDLKTSRSMPLTNFNTEDNATLAIASQANIIKTTLKSSEAPYLLLVEDNPLALKMVQIAASSAGCKYESAENAMKALELAKNYHFNLIITDIGLPCMSGIELTNAIRKWDNLSHNKMVPIIGLTAHTGEDEAKKCIEAGMNKILFKPATFKLLQDLLEEFIIINPDEVPNKPSFMIKEETSDLAPLPLIDIKKGIETLGNEDFFKEVVVLMLDEGIEEDKRNLQRAYLNQEWDKIQALAHKIKGGAAYCGMVKLHTICEQIEKYQKKGQVELIKQRFNEFIKVIEDTKKEVEEWCKLNCV